VLSIVDFAKRLDWEQIGEGKEGARGSAMDKNGRIGSGRKLGECEVRGRDAWWYGNRYGGCVIWHGTEYRGQEDLGGMKKEGWRKRRWRLLEETK
jgi:hypothetical protein